MLDLLNSIGYARWALPVLLAWPLVGALLIYLFGRTALPGREPGFARWREVRALTLIVFIAEAVLSLGLWVIFDPQKPGWQAGFDYPWIPDWGARFTLGIDGISLVQVLLTTLLMPLALLGSWDNVKIKVRSYYALLLVLTTGILGVFLATDLLLFYVFWELMLVPMYFMIGIWGGAKRVRASIKYFLFTMGGSLLMLLAIVVVWVAGGSNTFNYDALLTRMNMTVVGQLWLFGAFFFAFAVKSPLFPFHTWLPDAQHEAPTTAAVALSLKVGTYGILRFAMPFFPAAALDPTMRTVIIALSLIGIIYGALVAMVQPDFKKLVSYASISHLGFVTLGLFALTVQSVQGALMVMVNSGISTAALFILVGMLHDRRKTGMIHNFGGIARVVPLFAAALTLVSLSSIGLPGTVGFVGEFLVLIGTYATFPWAAIVATTGVVFAAIYLLWAIQRIIFNPLSNPENENLPDLNRRELGVMIAFAAIIVWLGITPGPVLSRMEGASARVVEQVRRGAANPLADPASVPSPSSTP